nr:hypothetical protein [Polymorphobacter sp.]
MRWRLLLLALVALTPSLARADVPIEYQARIEPRFPGVAALGTVAIAPFTGTDGKEFAAALRAELQSAEVEGRAFYTIRNIDDAAKPETAAAAIKAGQAAGVAAVFFGAVAKAVIDKTEFKQDQSRCVESGVLHCAKGETVQIPCTRYAGTYIVTPAVHVVADAKVFYTETVTVLRGFSTCSETPVLSGFDKVLAKMTEIKHANDVVITSPEQLLLRLRSDAAIEVRKHLTPTAKVIKVTFKDQARDLTKPDQEQFRSAAQFARAKRLDRACGIFETLNTPDKANNVALLYNLGVCQEALEPDRPAAALEYYAKADQRTTTPDRLVSEAFLRTKALVDALPPGSRR